MRVQYYTSKPASGRYVFFPDSVTEIHPDGSGFSITPVPMPEREGYEYYYQIGEYIPKADCVNGIYVAESDYTQMIAELNKEEEEEEDF